MIIGICDDESNARKLIESYIKRIDVSDSICHFAKGDDVIRHMRQGKHLDILYLDIDLRDASIDGMALASMLKNKQIREGTGASALPLIVFVTGLPERMPEAFGVRAFQFLVKPIDERDFILTHKQAKRAVLYAPKLSKGRTISVNSGGAKKTIAVKDISFIESSGRKLIFHTGDAVIETYGTIADIQDSLNESFFQVHRSFIVNMAFISDYMRNSVQMSSGEPVPMSKHKYRDFVTNYAAFLESGL